MKELRIIIAGGRDFNDFELLFKSVEKIQSYYVDKYFNELSRICIVSGTALKIFRDRNVDTRRPKTIHKNT